VKKIAFIIVCAICLAIILPLPTADATSSYHFIVINDKVEPLKKDTVPIEYEGVMYVPLSIFNSTALKTYYITDSKNRIATIYSTSQFLRFNIGSETRDDENNSYSYSAILVNTSFYVPAKEVCEFFGFGYSVVNDPATYPFIRITNSDAVLSDSAFARAAASRMQALFTEFLDSFAPTPTPTPTPFPTPTPTPTPTSPARPEVSVYLSFFGAGDEALRVLNLLTLYGDSACFFFTADEIRENADLVRRIAAYGHSIGLICSENLIEDYKEASKLLFEAARIKSVLIALEGEYTKALGEAAEDMGLIIWCDSSLRIHGKYSTLYPWEITYPLGLEDKRADLAIHCSGAFPALSEVFSFMYRNDFSVKPINELTETYLTANGVY
jgi:hypothetical protein